MATVEPMSHDALVAWSVEYLNRLLGSYAYETHGGQKHKPKEVGIADVGNVRGGLAYYYEIKIGKDAVRPDQLRFRDSVRQAGGHWNVIRSPEDLVACIAREKQNDARR